MEFKDIITEVSMIETLQKLGHTSPTPIQEKTLSFILAKNDVLAKAKTGSGKTAAFGIPLLLNLNTSESKAIQGIIITPTRELATQVATQLRLFAKFRPNIKVLTLTGGEPVKKQARSLEHGAHIVVGTPGRILDLLSKELLHVDKIFSVILDEADKMLDMGFLDEINALFEYLPSKRQTLLFSATFDERIKELSKRYQNKRIEVEINEHSNTKQENFYVKEEEKREALLNAIYRYRPHSSIIFTNTKAKSQELEIFLQEKGFDALCINSDLEQIDRDETLIKFANESLTFLLATDIASRGLDVKDVSLVINYDIPKNETTLTHRNGRTGRFNKEGLAVNFLPPTKENPQSSLHVEKDCSTYEADMSTLCIAGGKKQKLRPTDIVGVLIKQTGIDASCIGKINVTDFYSYVAIDRKYVKKVFNKLKSCTIKTRRYKIWIV